MLYYICNKLLLRNSRHDIVVLVHLIKHDEMMECCEMYKVERLMTRQKHHILVYIWNVLRDKIKHSDQVMNERTEIGIRYLCCNLVELDMTRFQCKWLWWILRPLTVITVILIITVIHDITVIIEIIEIIEFLKFVKSGDCV